MALGAAGQGQIPAERDVIGGVSDSQTGRIVINQFRLRMVLAQSQTEAGQRPQTYLGSGAVRHRRAAKERDDGTEVLIAQVVEHGGGHAQGALPISPNPVPDDALQLGIRVLRHHLSQVRSHDATQEWLVDEDSAIQPLSMAAIVATANGSQPLTLGQDEGIGRQRNG